MLEINVPLKIYHPSILKGFKNDEYYSSVDIFKLIESLSIRENLRIFNLLWVSKIIIGSKIINKINKT